jgi:hemoglobin
MEIGPEPVETHAWGEARTPYDEVGGDVVVRALVEGFYDLIEADSPPLRAMLPRDTSTSRQKLYEFLSGWLGGPPLYMERRGHPRLRMRHMPFDIGTPEADEWMRCMKAAITSVGIGEPAASFLISELGLAAHSLRNRPDPGVIVPTVSAT